MKKLYLAVLLLVPVMAFSANWRHRTDSGEFCLQWDTSTGDIWCFDSDGDFSVTSDFTLGTGGLLDVNGIADGLVLDADADTSLSAPTDDQIDVEIAGADDFRFTANTFQVLSGSLIQSSSDHLKLNAATTSSDVAGKTVRINSITNTGTADSLIGFQSKPGQGASTAQNVIGGEISPRVNDTFALTGSGSLIGLHVDAYLKGTTGDIAGDVRGQQIELVTDDAGTHTVSGDVIGLRFRSAFSATAITGNFVPIEIEKPETQTNSQNYDAALSLTSTLAGVWNDDPTTELDNPGGTVKGYIKVLVNGNARYIALYEAGNLAD